VIEVSRTFAEHEKSKNSTQDRWLRFHKRMKVILFSFSANVEQIPNSTIGFLSKLTVGTLRIPHEFLLEFEA